MTLLIRLIAIACDLPFWVGRIVLRVACPRFKVSAVAFVPGRPVLVTGGFDTTAISWDLRALFGNAPSSESADNLWTALGNDDPAIAFRAGMTLMPKHQLAQRTRMLKPLATLEVDVSKYRRLITELSSRDSSAKERAHKQLEAAGQRTLAELRRALAVHPGGETEEWLKDLIRLASTNEIPPQLLTAEDGNILRPELHEFAPISLCNADANIDLQIDQFVDGQIRFSQDTRNSRGN